MRIRWTEQADADLDSIEAYISRDSPAVAIKTVLDIIEAVEQLREYPALGRSGHVAGTRELVIPSKPYIVPYILPYRMKGGAIEILGVLHASREWPKDL